MYGSSLLLYVSRIDPDQILQTRLELSYPRLQTLSMPLSSIGFRSRPRDLAHFILYSRGLANEISIDRYVGKGSEGMNRSPACELRIQTVAE